MRQHHLRRRGALLGWRHLRLARGRGVRRRRGGCRSKNLILGHLRPARRRGVRRLPGDAVVEIVASVERDEPKPLDVAAALPAPIETGSVASSARESAAGGAGTPADESPSRRRSCVRRSRRFRLCHPWVRGPAQPALQSVSPGPRTGTTRSAERLTCANRAQIQVKFRWERSRDVPGRFGLCHQAVHGPAGALFRPDLCVDGGGGGGVEGGGPGSTDWRRTGAGRCRIDGLERALRRI